MSRGQQSSYQCWFIYAMGGGLGHFHRSIALARAAVRRSYIAKVVVLTNSPLVDRLSMAEEIGNAIDVVALNPNLDRCETIAKVKETFHQSQFDHLIVDTFPRGLGGELPEIVASLSCPKVLVHRDLNPRYVEQANLAEVCQQFDKLIVPGESATFESMPHAVRTSPWLIRDSSELLSPQEARNRLMVSQESIPVIAVVGCGRSEEVDEMQQIARRLDQDFEGDAAVRFLAPRVPQTSNVLASNVLASNVLAINLWPLMKVLSGVSVVVGSGGYNTVQEARAIGVPLIGLPRRRLYDSQSRRLEGGWVARNYEDVRSLVEMAIRETKQAKKSVRPVYENGVHQAVELIGSL